MKNLRIRSISPNIRFLIGFAMILLATVTNSFAQRDLSIVTNGGKQYIPENCRRYEMNIITGNVEGAGTDGNILITFNGDNGSTGEINLSGGASPIADSNDDCSLNGKEFKGVRYLATENEYSVLQSNLFERNTNFRIVVYTRDVGHISSVSLRNDRSGAGADWLLNRLEIRSPHELVMTSSHWFTSETDTHTFSIAEGDFFQQSETYTVRIYTGDESGAGTDSNIDLKIGNGRVMRLNPLMSGNAFERNQTDTIIMKNQPILDPKTITITSDNSYAGSAWYLGSIEIDRTFGFGPALIAKYTCNCWIKSGGLSVTLSNEYTTPKAPQKSYEAEEKRCFDLVQNKVPYDTAGNKTWVDANVKNLCYRTTDPELSIACFGVIMKIEGWEQAIQKCSGSSSITTMNNQKSIGVTQNPPTSSSADVLIPGAARDIDAKNGVVYVIGNGVVPGGAPIFKLNSDRQSWEQIDGGAVRIAVDESGNPWVINSEGTIFRRTNNGWTVIPGPSGYSGVDIAISNSGEVWVVTDGGSVWSWNNGNWSQLIALSAKRVIFTPNPNVFHIIGDDGKRYMRETPTSWVFATDATGLAAKYIEYAIEDDGTKWAVDSSLNIWKLAK